MYYHVLHNIRPHCTCVVVEAGTESEDEEEHQLQQDGQSDEIWTFVYSFVGVVGASRRSQVSYF